MSIKGFEEVDGKKKKTASVTSRGEKNIQKDLSWSRLPDSMKVSFCLAAAETEKPDPSARWRTWSEGGIFVDS